MFNAVIRMRKLIALVYFSTLILSTKGQTIRCHDCAKDGCEEFILKYPHRTGRCEIDLGEGKCFIRKDPNDRIYWGCIDDYFWPDVPWRTFNGCTEDWDRSWEHRGIRKPMIWCFCDYDLCNESINRLNRTGGSTAPVTSQPTTPDGKEGPDEDTCSNIVGPDTSCDHFCDVIDGRIQCSCREGYFLAADGRTCRDEDECRITNGGCSQICINTPGSYLCTCNSGFTIGLDERSCYDIDECLLNNGGCSHTCQNMIGSFVCSCQAGFQLLPDGLNCQDVDECLVDNGRCSDTCTNTIGSFFCACATGYELIYDSFRCEDINECLREVDTCEGTCINTPGSFDCACHLGYALQNDGKSCADINECILGLSNCVQTCINTHGSFLCECHRGYTLSLDKQSCIDVNECVLPGQAGCEHYCQNTPGSYTCSCRKGFRLHPDGRSCLDDDECANDNGGCQQICSNVAGGVQCSCREGFQPVDLTQCHDINECSFSNGGCEQSCINTPGSYECRCDYDDLFILAPDNHSCHTRCPEEFVQDYLGRSCYYIVTPKAQEKFKALDYYEAENACQALHTQAHLVTVNDASEKEFLKRSLQQMPLMLEGWQGWWTSAKYHSGVGEFAWSPMNQLVDRDSPLWSFKKTPYADTCLWIMQPSSYDYTWGNYECVTKSGYICEISLPDRDSKFLSNK